MSDVERSRPSPGLLVAITLAAAFAFALLIALVGSLLVAVLVGLAILATGSMPSPGAGGIR